MSNEAARMREMARRKIDLMISEAQHGLPGPGRDALIAARDAIAALPLPPTSDKTAVALRLAREALERLSSGSAFTSSGLVLQNAEYAARRQYARETVDCIAALDSINGGA